MPWKLSPRCNYWAHSQPVLKTACSRARALQQWEACVLHLEKAHFQQQRAHESQEDPVQSKKNMNQIIIQVNKMLQQWWVLWRGDTRTITYLPTYYIYLSTFLYLSSTYRYWQSKCGKMFMIRDACIWEWWYTDFCIISAAFLSVWNSAKIRRLLQSTDLAW